MTSTAPSDIADGLVKYRVRFISKADSRLMGFVAWLLATLRIMPRDVFMGQYWTTLPRLPLWWRGVNVYHPAGVDPLGGNRWGIVRHEVCGHGPQLTGWIGPIRSLVLTLARWPIRWRGDWEWIKGTWLIERGPYLVDIRAGRYSMTVASSILWHHYGQPAPVDLMVEWWRERL